MFECFIYVAILLTNNEKEINMSNAVTMEELRQKYEVVISLDVHAQIKTKSKNFAPDGKKGFFEKN